MKTLKTSIADDQRLGSAVIGEKEYYEAMTSSGTPIRDLGFFVAVIMAIGSAFAATNTMYGAVAPRPRDRHIAGDRIWPMDDPMVVHAGIDLPGASRRNRRGIDRAAGQRPDNRGRQLCDVQRNSLPVSHRMAAVLGGLAFAAIIGALGGFLPAWSASKKGIVDAMRKP